MRNRSFTLIRVKTGMVRVKTHWAIDVLNPDGSAELNVQAGKVYYFEVTDLQPSPPELGIASSVAVLRGNKSAAGTAAIVVLIGLVRYKLEGNGLTPEDEWLATRRLKECCHYVPVDDDYAPPDSLPVATDLQATADP